ncbi:hypothetical protein [Promicromonospora sp. NPDC057488]|uniref:hypothetical protein n=1 Tax=Promicromonospora sp. NPDC057488 TaxID=3346147 RepID=UPI00366F2AF4
MDNGVTVNNGVVVNDKEPRLRVHPYWGTLVAAGAVTVLGMVLLVELGYSADASAESLPEWRYLVPWAVFGTGMIGLIALGAAGPVLLKRPRASFLVLSCAVVLGGLAAAALRWWT